MFQLIKVPVFEITHYFLVDKTATKKEKIDEDTLRTEFTALASTVSKKDGEEIGLFTNVTFDKDVIDEFILNDKDSHEWDVEVEAEIETKKIVNIYLKDQLI